MSPTATHLAPSAVRSQLLVRIIISLYNPSSKSTPCAGPSFNNSLNALLCPSQAIRRSQALPEPLSQLRFAELVQLEQTLFTQVHALHVGRVLCGWLGHSAGDDDGVGLEDDAVVDDFVDCERGEVVVLDQCALVDGVSAGGVAVSLVISCVCVYTCMYALLGGVLT